jgi:hypothetical protein
MDSSHEYYNEGVALLDPVGNFRLVTSNHLTPPANVVRGAVKRLIRS